MPTTEFEDNGGTARTSPEGERAFLQTVATETDAVLIDAGTSVQGRTIWRVDLGATSGTTWMVVASQHGNEWAGREAALIWLRDLAYSTDQDVVDYLAAHRIVFIPSANPDGIVADTRNNANDEDLNQHYFDLSEPENQVVTAVRVAVQPELLVDMHEGISFSEDITYLTTQTDALYSGLTTTGDDVIDDVGDALDLDGTYSHDLYPGSSSRASLRESAAMGHAVGITTESLRSNDPDDRVAADLIVLEAIREYVADNAGDLADLAAASREYQSTTTDDYVLNTGGGVPPWTQVDLPSGLLGYRIAGLAPAAFSAYGVQVAQGSIVELSQEARAVIPILLDSESDDQLLDATRLFSLEPAASVATVQEFAEVVYGSHRMVAEAWVLSTFQTGNNPSGTLIDILSGSVTMDATAEVFATLELETSGMDERRRSRFPRRAGDLLAPYGTEVFVRRGVDIGSEIMWSPLGYFRLNDDEQSPASDSPIRLSGQDRMSRIVKGRLAIPRQYGRSRTFAEVVSSLVTDIYPAAVIVFDDDSGEAQIGRTLLVEEDRYAGLLDLAESLGKVIYFDGEGVLRIEDPPPADDLVWHLKAGYHGVLYDNDRRVSDEDMSNGIVVRGEGGDTQTPVLAIVVDAGPNSPTSWFPPDDPAELWFGQVPDFYSSPFVTTATQAVSAGTSLLRRRIGLPYSVSFGSVVNPALRPRQAVRLTQKSGDRERHIIETLTIPLSADRSMQGTTREQTNVRISEVQPSTLRGS